MEIDPAIILPNKCQQFPRDLIAQLLEILELNDMIVLRPRPFLIREY